MPKVKILAVLSAVICLLEGPAVIAQQKTPYGDDVSTLDGIMKAYYAVVTVKKGEKVSYERDSLLHVPNALVGMAQKGENGKVTLRLVTLKQYHQASDAELERNGFYEAEISRKVEQFGAIYQVWSTYETRNEKNGPVTERGINSIQLYFDGTRFWILSWVFDSESKGQPIPEKYLKN
ncbi:MAG: hypothetical protein U0U70_09100 [Chitinophagaceae bacterium]